MSKSYDRQTALKSNMSDQKQGQKYSEQNCDLQIAQTPMC